MRVLRILQDVKARAYESYLELKLMLFLGVGQAEAKDFAGGSVDWQEEKITFIRCQLEKASQSPTLHSREIRSGSS